MASQRKRRANNQRNGSHRSSIGGREGRCPTGKIRYGQRKAAESVLWKTGGKAKKQGRKGRKMVVPTRAYLCHMCDGWHLTSEAERPVEHPPKRPNKDNRVR